MWLFDCFLFCGISPWQGCEVCQTKEANVDQWLGVSVWPTGQVCTCHCQHICPCCVCVQVFITAYITKQGWLHNIMCCTYAFVKSSKCLAIMKCCHLAVTWLPEAIKFYHNYTLSLLVKLHVTKRNTVCLMVVVVSSQSWSELLGSYMAPVYE